MKIKNRSECLFNDMIINIKDFDSSLLEKPNYHLKWFLVLLFSTLNTPLRKSPDHANVDNDDDKDFLYLFLDDVDVHIEENNGIKYLVFTSADKNKEALKNYIKLWKGNKEPIEVINDNEPVRYRKDFMKIKF